MFYLKNKKNKGFTLIETMVAISVLLVSIVAPLNLARQGIQSFRFSKNQIKAFYLAQEGVEYIRNKRDTNFLETNPNWLNGLSSCIDNGTGNKCIVDVITDTVNACGVNCNNLRNSPTGLYGYTFTWDETDFRRDISILELTPEEALIEVGLYWKNGTKSYVLREIIFNFLP